LQNNLEFSALKGIGTGDGGRIIAENVQAYLQSKEVKQQVETKSETPQSKPSPADQQVTANQ